jgi:hypothetical protein
MVTAVMILAVVLFNVYKKLNLDVKIKKFFMNLRKKREAKLYEEK